jgi:hypothetical protein
MDISNVNRKEILKEKERLKKQRQRAKYSEEQKTEIRNRQCEYMRKKRLAKSEEEKEQERVNNQQHLQKNVWQRAKKRRNKNV